MHNILIWFVYIQNVFYFAKNQMYLVKAKVNAAALSFTKLQHNL